MKRYLIFSGTLCGIALFLIVLFLPSVPQPSGTTAYFSYGTPVKHIGSVVSSEVTYRVATQRMITAGVLDVEIDWIPENGIYLTLGVELRKHGVGTSPTLEKTWKYTFYNTTQLPFKKTIPLAVSVSDSDFGIPVGETPAFLEISAVVDVIKLSGETETAAGSFSTGRDVELLSEYPPVALFTANAFGIGFALLLVGISIAVVEVVVNLEGRRKKGDTARAL